MSLRPSPLSPVPEDTARVARAAFPKGNAYLQLRDALGQLFDDASFTDLFSCRGQPALAPWRLALVTVWQFAEGLSDRQAAEAVRARIDWKYALGLSLSDPGFDFSVLCEFRARLVVGAAEQQLLDTILERCLVRGYVKARGRQRTDSTHVLGAVRVLNRLERVGETLRAALNAVAQAAPDWLATQAEPAWLARYGRRVEEYRLPKGTQARAAYAVQVGSDGLAVLAAVAAPDAPAGLRELASVERLRQVWLQQYVVIEGVVQLREPADMPPYAVQLASPYEPEVRFGNKRQTQWLGYKVHLTESCDDEQPHLITQVTTTVASTADISALGAMQQALADRGLLPAEQLLDPGYLAGHTVVESAARHAITLVGPANADHQWQARAQTGYALAQFQVDWAAQRVTCPEQQQSRGWYAHQTARGPRISVMFAASDCAACPVRSACTRATRTGRRLTLQPQAAQQALVAARQQQRTAAFQRVYAKRAGIEGTLSQGVRGFGLRQARYRGLAKTQLQHVATAAAINLSRLSSWLAGATPAPTRQSRFAALMAVA